MCLELKPKLVYLELMPKLVRLGHVGFIVANVVVLDSVFSVKSSNAAITNYGFEFDSIVPVFITCGLCKQPGHIDGLVRIEINFSYRCKVTHFFFLFFL